MSKRCVLGSVQACASGVVSGKVPSHLRQFAVVRSRRSGSETSQRGPRSTDPSARILSQSSTPRPLVGQQQHIEGSKTRTAYTEEMSVY